MHSVTLRVGPASFRIGSAWRAPVAALARLYAAYPPVAEDVVPDFTVRLDPARPWRRIIRPSVRTSGDYMLADAAPLPLDQGLLAAEMGMNLQMALGWRRHLLLHASSAACQAGRHAGRALVMTGESGSGKSTLAAMLGELPQWRLMGDEFALLSTDPQGAVWPFPRPVSLKNQSIETMERLVDDSRFGPLLPGTPKGDIRHLVPDARAIADMDRPALPALLLFPRFGGDPVVRPVPAGEAFVRLTQASTNYGALGEAGFETLTRFVQNVPAMAMDFQTGEQALEMVRDLWESL